MQYTYTHLASDVSDEEQERETLLLLHTFVLFIVAGIYRMCIWFVETGDVCPIIHWQVRAAFRCYTVSPAAVDDLCSATS